MKKPATQHPAASGKIGARMARMPSVSQPSPGGRGSYDVHDEVFFHSASGPRSGRVVAHGQHGCTVDEPGGSRHQVTWDAVLGLKGRKTFPARVVDHGAGGAILEREDGSRFFAAGDVPVAADPDDLSCDEVLQKADEIARLGERISLLAAAPLSAIPPPGMLLLWGCDVS